MQVTKNIQITKAGGNASKNAKNYRVQLPVEMVKLLGITEDDRSVTISFSDGAISIKKAGD